MARRRRLCLKLPHLFLEGPDRPGGLAAVLREMAGAGTLDRSISIPADLLADVFASLAWRKSGRDAFGIENELRHEKARRGGGLDEPSNMASALAIPWRCCMRARGCDCGGIEAQDLQALLAAMRAYFEAGRARQDAIGDEIRKASAALDLIDAEPRTAGPTRRPSRAICPPRSP